MIVFQNSIITIQYFPDTDTLTVDWVDLASVTFAEVQESFRKIVEVLRHYDAKNLLLDGSTGRVRFHYAEYQTLIRELGANLLQTRLQKLARIVADDPEREEAVKQVRQEMASPYQFQDFNNRDAALRWLAGR